MPRWLPAEQLHARHPGDDGGPRALELFDVGQRRRTLCGTTPTPPCGCSETCPVSVLRLSRRLAAMGAGGRMIGRTTAVQTQAPGR